MNDNPKMDSDRGPSRAPHPGSSAGGMTHDERIEGLTAALRTRSLPVSVVRPSLSRAMHEKEEGQKETYFNTPETADATRIRNLEADNNRLKSEIAELERELDETRTELLEELSELRSKNYFNPTKYADSEIRKDWSQLGFLIQQFVSNHFPDMLRLEDLQKAEDFEQYSHVGEVCAEPGSVLQSGFVYPYLVESMVWRFIKKEIFDPESKLWAGEIGKKFDNICGKITGCVKKLPGNKKTEFDTAYHEWRSRSVSFFVDLGMDKKSKDTPIAMEMMDQLRQFISPRASRRRFPQEVLTDATEIINKAVDINIQFKKSKADFTVIFSGGVRSNHSRPFGYHFDTATMNQISLLPSSNQPGQASPSIVDMAVSPGLIKCGNADGTNYQSKKVLAKMRVVCDLDAWFNDVDDEEDDEDIDNDGESATSGHPTVTPQNPEDNEGDSDVSLVTAPEYANNSEGPDSQSTDRSLAQNGDHENKEQMNESTIIVAEHGSATVEHEEQEGGACDVAKSKRNSPERFPLTGEGEVLNAVMVHPQVEEAEESPEAMDLDGNADSVNLPPVPKVDHEGDLQMGSD